MWEDHPCVLISNEWRVDRKERRGFEMSDALFGRPAGERFGSRADGSRWIGSPDRLHVDLLFTAKKSEISQKRGEVSPERRRDISRKIIQGLALAGL
jgi:hypothetical protein